MTIKLHLSRPEANVLIIKKSGGKRNQHMGIISFWNDRSPYQD